MVAPPAVSATGVPPGVQKLLLDALSVTFGKVFTVRVDTPLLVTDVPQPLVTTTV